MAEVEGERKEKRPLAGFRFSASLSKDCAELDIEVLLGAKRTWDRED